MIYNILILAMIVITSIGLGFNLGHNVGLKHGIDIAMETAIRETIKHLQTEFEKVGLRDQFTDIIQKTFDTKKLNL